MAEPITSGRAVRDAVAKGWELWHVAKPPYVTLPGYWELRRGYETARRVHWDAIEIIRRRYLSWFEEHTEEIQEGRNTWCYRLKQRSLSFPERAA